jgi:hypothetical protein
LCNCFVHSIAAALERDHDGIRVFRQGALGDSNRLKGSHSAFHQHTRKVSGTSEVIGDAA